MNSKLPLISAHFVATGMTFSPHECSPKFRLRPTKVKIKGQIQHGIVLRFLNQRGLFQKMKRYDSWDIPMAALMEIIWPKRHSITRFATQKKLKICFVLNLREGVGELNCLRKFSSPHLVPHRIFQSPTLHRRILKIRLRGNLGLF
jgi:hypothetical protein